MRLQLLALAQRSAAPGTRFLSTTVSRSLSPDRGQTKPSDLVYTHARDAHFSRGLRSFFEYRDLGINRATNGAVAAHVIHAVPGTHAEGVPHRHDTKFQMVYVLQGWVEFEYEQPGSPEPVKVRLEKGSCVYQPPNIRHREVAHSDDVEMLEIVLPGDFRTEDVPSVQ